MKRYLIVIDESFANELISKGMELLNIDTNNKIWTFAYDINKFTVNEDSNKKCFITNKFKMNF